jgi:hypothetical protein
VKLTWSCVLDDGTRPFGPGIQEDQRRPLRLVASEDTAIEVAVINPVGGTIAFGAGEFLQLNGRSLLLPSREVFTVRSTPIGNHRLQLTLAGDVTKLLKVGRGTFDLWAIRSSGRSCLIPSSELLIAGSAIARNYL